MQNHQWRRGMWQPETLRLAGDFAEPMRSGDKKKPDLGNFTRHTANPTSPGHGAHGSDFAAVKSGVAETGTDKCVGSVR